MASFNVMLAYIGAAICAALLLICIALAVVHILMTNSIAVVELEKISRNILRPMECLNYTEIPIGVIAVIADSLGFSVNDVGAQYAKESRRRYSTILQTFKKDPVSDNFIYDFNSKFITHGFAGEAAIAKMK